VNCTTKTLSGLQVWRRKESGLAEAATVIFVLPIIFALLFLTLEVGLYMSTRTQLDNIVQDTTRSAATDGGYANSRATSLNLTAYPNGWATVGTLRLRKACTDLNVRSKNACSTLAVVCEDASGNQTAARALPFAGDTIRCRLGAPFAYRVASPLSTTPVFSFGMSKLFTSTITVTAESRTALGRNG
jgi:Flp pilus assembly protein TadG